MEIINHIPENPTVIIYFTGLLMFRHKEATTGKSEYCEIHTLRTAPGHEFTITVREKQPGLPAATIWRHCGHLTGSWLDVNVINPAPKLGGIKKHQIKGEFNRADHYKDKKYARDFRWTIDLESEECHKKLLDINPQGVYPYLCLNTGLFYTAMKTDFDKVSLRLKLYEEEKELYSIASIIGANIYLDHKKQGKVQFKWKHEKNEFLSLPRTAAAEKTIYEIHIENDPLLIHNMDMHSHVKTYLDEVPPPTTHFRRLYDVITNVSLKEQYDIEATPKKPPFTPDIPCMSGVLGGGK